MTWRIAIGQISNESSTFSPFRCDLDLIRASGYILTGEDVLDLRDGQSEVAGFLRSCERAGSVEIVPIIASRRVTPGVTRDTAFDYLHQSLRQGLIAVGPIDAILLSCHGSLVTESAEDPEGDMIEEHARCWVTASLSA